MSDMPYILHTPQTPHTPGTGDLPLLASSPSSVPNPNAACSSHLPEPADDLSALTSSDLPSDLNFDPESVINGEGSGQEELNVSTPGNMLLAQLGTAQKLIILSVCM